MGLVLGANPYAHSAATFLLSSEGEAVFALSKERVSRKKHDGGDLADLIRYAFSATGTRRRDLDLIVQSNHLFRLGPFHETLPWATALNQYAPGHTDPDNLLPGVPRWELSHHLAHAWSALPTAPFDRGLIVVMDGMGSTRKDIQKLPVNGAASPIDKQHVTDADLPCARGFAEWPADLDERRDWREAETVYRFTGLELELVWKRWQEEKTPTLLYNTGFENMESLGAVYSRVASHLFGDWNACGKVMGLAPYAAERGGARRPVVRGELERLRVNWKRLRDEPFPNGWGSRGSKSSHEDLAADVQRDLERVALRFLKRLRRETGERNLCLVGGVALNCSLNGRIAREAGFEQVFIPPWPGDDGTAAGCAHFGLHRVLNRRKAPRRSPHRCDLGRAFAPTAIARALARPEFAPFLAVERPDDLHRCVADALAAHEVIGWFQGRSEFGPRALGFRSILAHPGRKATTRRVNSIKRREPFRPFGPVVLAERADEWFASQPDAPWMSYASPVLAPKRRKIAAVVHVDGTTRAQTLHRAANPHLYGLLEAFEERTGLPLLLNTSFNLKGQPLVETPEDALRMFLDTDLDRLVLEDSSVQKLPYPDAQTLPAARPLAIPGVTAETVTDSEGEPIRVQFYAFGEGFESDPLELALWEAADGNSSVDEILADFATQGVEPEDLLPPLRNLFDRRVLAFA